MSDHTRSEVCAVAIAEVSRGDGEILASPIGNLPSLGARLAKLTFEPDLLLTDGVASLLAQEWESRRALIDGITNERVDAMMQAALGAGALANKLCGAGGGGCMVTYVEPDDRDRVETALDAAGAEVMPLKIINEGISVERLKQRRE